MPKKSIEAFSLPTILRNQITALIEAGYYNSRSDVVKDALRTLISSQPGYKIAASRILLKKRMITMDEACSMAGKDKKEMQAIMREKR